MVTRTAWSWSVGQRANFLNPVGFAMLVLSFLRKNLIKMTLFDPHLIAFVLCQGHSGHYTCNYHYNQSM